MQPKGRSVAEFHWPESVSCRFLPGGGNYFSESQSAQLVGKQRGRFIAVFFFLHMSICNQDREYSIITRYKGTQGWTWDLCKSCILSGNPCVRHLSHNNNYIQATECSPRCLNSKLNCSLASLNCTEQLVTVYMSNLSMSVMRRHLSVSLSIHLPVCLSIYQLYFCLGLNTSYKVRYVNPLF